MFEPLLLAAHNPSPMTGDGNNTYLLAGRGGAAVLIDAGVGEPAHVATIAAALREHDAQLGLVLVTHGHRDHAGGAPALAAAHPAAAFAKHPWPEEDHRFTVRWQPIGEGDVVTAGSEPLAVLHTPGHSPDHLAFWHEPTRTLFTGDLVVRGSSVMIHSSRGGTLAQYLASLERLPAPAAGTRTGNRRSAGGDLRLHLPSPVPRAAGRGGAARRPRHRGGNRRIHL